MKSAKILRYKMVHDIGCKDYLMKQVREDWDVWFFKMKSAMDYRIMQGEQWLRSEGSRIHFMLRYVPDIEPYRFVHRRYGDMWTTEGYFNRNKHTYGYQNLPSEKHFLTDLKYCENEWRVRETRGQHPSTSSKRESSGNRTVDGNSEDPGVIPKPPSAADDFQNLRTVTYVSDDERNNRTFIIVLDGVQPAPGLDGGMMMTSHPH
ncbi:uncharacterized protein LOC125492785 [Beta vulgaris subsp. vulgaris]|uniref:uncharacterized protein LOC125492785 n=1 Tax=Beta vulgaris subsp. vulgaris TaxID=3555 RepID=UPI0025476721|nr:uncharacterized protein LOC125492785 [Beta vulgaris subsp. vulgaris]